MQILRNRSAKIAKICLIGLCPAFWVFAQKTPSDKVILSGFETRIEAGKLSEVESDLFNYLRANPNNAGGFALMAELRFKQGRFAEARSLSIRALALDPNLVTAKLTLASAHFQLGELQQSRAILDGISESQISDDSVRLKVVQTSALVGDCPRALRSAEKLLARVKDGEALPIRAACLLDLGDTKNFALLIPISKSTAKQDPDAALKFAEVLSRRGLHKDTVALLRSVVASDPKNFGALLLLARSEIYLKDLPNSRIHLAQAEKLRPKSSELLLTRAFLESEQGNHVKALELLEGSLALDPNNIEALTQFVVTAMRANQSGKAVRAAERLMELKPENPEFIYLHGAASLQNNRLQNAETSLAKYMELRPRDSRGCLALGLTFAAQAEKQPEARQQLQHCMTIDPLNYEAAYQLGLSYKTEGDSAKAIEFFEQTVRLSPNHVSALRDLGDVYMQTGEEAKARVVLERAVVVNPNDADAHFQLSRLYNIIGERELGKKHLLIFQKLKTPKKDGM